MALFSSATFIKYLIFGFQAKDSQSPGIVKPPKNERKRARMMVDKSPDVITPRKRKPTTRTRSIKDMLMCADVHEKENQEKKLDNTKGDKSKVEFKTPDTTRSSDSPGAVVTSASMKTVKSGKMNYFYTFSIFLKDRILFKYENDNLIHDLMAYQSCTS